MKGTNNIRIGGAAGRTAAFSLIEVNMAVFVLAVGILALMSLFPAGLRESLQSRADLRQAMFADYALSVLAAKGSDPGMTFAEFKAGAFTEETKLSWTGPEQESGGGVSQTYTPDGATEDRDDMRYRLVMADGTSEQCLEMAVQSTELAFGRFHSNPVFFTTVFFQGKK